MSIRLLRNLIREILVKEADISDAGDVCYTAGSTHVMKTCKIGKDKYFLKFSDDTLFEGVDPSLQILIEYLAYRIYGLFSGINEVELELEKRDMKKLKKQWDSDCDEIKSTLSKRHAEVLDHARYVLKGR